MKIAAITEDGLRISKHFGRAPFYLVLTVEDGEIVDHEQRQKFGHAQVQHEEGHHIHAHGPHGYGPQAETRHERMVASISDCQVLLCGGMGRGAYEALAGKGITPILTDICEIDGAVRAYLDQTIVDHRELLH